MPRLFNGIIDMEAPIIFIHYNDSYYLKYVLQSAKMFNPDKHIILIGDKSNRRYTEIGVEHYMFDQYLQSSQLEKFNEVYKRIGGNEFEKVNSSKGGQDWTKFNFLKWFVLCDFVKEHNITRFWTFDSDTIILSNLNSLEIRYEDVDYTVMNGLNQLQGYVRNVKYLKLFQELSISMFSDERYLKRLKQKDFAENPTYGFTMMRVFKRLSEQSDPKIKRLNTIIDNTYFDECICVPHSKEVYREKIADRTVKKLYSDTKGNIYQYDLDKKRYIEVLGINLSWIPQYVFNSVFKYAQKKYNSRQKNDQEKGKEVKEISFQPPFRFLVKSKLRSVKASLSKV